MSKSINSLLSSSPLVSAMNIHDGGEYVCEIEADADDPIAIVHTVEILGELKLLCKNYRTIRHVLILNSFSIYP